MNTVNQALIGGLSILGFSKLLELIGMSVVDDEESRVRKLVIEIIAAVIIILIISKLC
jgi:hypothetical protein